MIKKARTRNAFVPIGYKGKGKPKPKTNGNDNPETHGKYYSTSGV